MGTFQFLIHLLSFAAPAFFVGAAVAFGARWAGLNPRPLRWWAQLAINAAVGTAVLAAGLWHFGVDGKMATYAALVVAIASAQWLCAKIA